MIILKNEISNSLADLFYLSFSPGKFLSVLKIAKVVPVYKKDSKLDYQNYCPIYLLSNIEKILKKLMYKHLYKFLNDNILYDLQFGFRQNFSTTYALINLTENIRHPWWRKNWLWNVFRYSKGLRYCGTWSSSIKTRPLSCMSINKQVV